MRRIQLFCLLLMSALTVKAQTGEPFWLGADISGTTELEARGVQLMNMRGEPRENTALMKELGLNAVRLRVWVNPRRGFSGKDDVVKMALRAKEQGMALMIDFHYSDWWADPGKQNIPQAWLRMNYGQMKRALAAHTQEVLQALKEQGVEVRWVQVGNETTHGFLWPVGRAEENMKQYAGLTKAGYKAVKKVYPEAEVIIHLDGGCDPQRFNFVFDGLRKYGCPWDIIGLSVYPYWDMEAKLETSWEGSVRDFTANVRALYQKYHTPLMVVETGVEAKKPVEGKQIMAEIIRASKEDCDGRCLGVFYWAPELEGHYPLGAFDGHKPTAIMEAFTEAAKH
ncbi:MAG: glycosyl hydrolase 53 family protein [Prevotella sp.]|nr:glycosyl hydrolase 53 family protein [Prevotella sp.]